MAIGSPATLFTTTATAPPAACTLRIFVENVQVPRATRTTCPVKLPERALHALLRPAAPSPEVAASTAVVSAETVANSPVAALNVPLGALICAVTKWPTVDAPAVSARVAEPGDSIV